jgi:two-component system LytT family sensor kinase
MAAKRGPLPPILRSITPLEWVIVLAAWLLLDFLSADPLSKQLAARGLPVTLHHVRVAQTLDWAVWALLLPAIFATLDRLPLRRKVWPKHLAGWAVAGLLFGVIHAVLSLPLIHLAARIMDVPPQVLSVPDLRLIKLIYDDAQNFNLAVIAYLVLQLVHRNRSERNRAREVERSLREARLHALAMELQPHFLFNTLNAIAALVRSDPKTAEQMLVRLSDLLRLTLESGKAVQLSLREELRQLDLYLGLQQMRHGDRLTIEKMVPRELEPAKIPAMLLQPLVENAISHGIGGRPGPGTLSLRAWREGARLYLSVEDDGIGIPVGGPAREGVGLANTRARLGALYPDDYEFRIEPRPEGGTRILIRLPYETDGAPAGGVW